MKRLSPRWWFELHFAPRDWWVGVRWQKRPAEYFLVAHAATCVEELELWICVVPLLPMHLIVAWKFRG